VSGADPDRHREPPAKPVPDRELAATGIVADRRAGAPKVIQARGAVLGRIEKSGRER
jgi:hypothetical protein